MKVLPHIKKNLMCFLWQGKIIILCCLIFPMIMAYMYGTMQKSEFDGKSNFKAVKVEFKYDKASDKGKVLDTILKQDKVKSFITEVSSDAQCSVTINSDFTEFNIKKLIGTDNNVELVRNFMQTFSENIDQYEIVSSNVNKLNISQNEKQKLIAQLLNKLQSGDSSTIKEQIIEGYKTMGAREYYTLSMFSMTSIMLILAIVKSFYKDRENGILKRAFSTPNNKESYFAGFVIYVFIICLFINLAYIFINRTAGIAFEGNTFSVLLIALIQSLIQAAVSGVIVALIKEESMVNTIMTCILVVTGIFGGVFYNSDFTGASIIKNISNLMPNSLILNSYKNLYITQGISGAGNEMIIGILLAIALLFISIIKVRKNWEG
ncbi:ABC transporter permease [Clostridium sp. 19966]|uniref:ABC transporter permease n=1 Tax=Clostridium sp. 19966 TaxID=2768166 RepID=UPI0028DD72C0|nr:ABC transporter permease [Clostridium sp. 19966]MDT8719593.1 ABC transporter permease [Clostridium sp. 19966]